MLNGLVTRRGLALALAVAGASLAGCSTANHDVGDAGMMGGESGYHASRLTCAAPETLPSPPVTVVVGDMGMTRMMTGTAPLGTRMLLRASPVAVPAGQMSFLVENTGWRTHEMVVMPLSDQTGAGQRVPGPDGEVDEAGSLGEASNACGEGAGDGLTSGSVGWLSVTLPAGRYELLCNLPNHYANGMWQEFDVT